MKIGAWLAVLTVPLLAGTASAQHREPFQPYSGQPGKDVVWVPTPYALIEKMLDMAKVTPQDFVIDLGSGDGRNVIAAAKRGARALGVEFNPQMVTLSRRNAEKEGVADKARFVEGDMFAADISRATVLALFLLPDNLRRLTPKFQGLRPGTRMVLNGFSVPDWAPDQTETATGDCGSWCTSHLYIVPAKVAGVWRLPVGTLTLEQHFQQLTGTLGSDGGVAPLSDARMSGEEIEFTVNGIRYAGRVRGNTMSGEGPNGPWTATRVRR